jgi:hypothetical protein
VQNLRTVDHLGNHGPCWPCIVLAMAETDPEPRRIEDSAGRDTSRNVCSLKPEDCVLHEGNATWLLRSVTCRPSPSWLLVTIREIGVFEVSRAGLVVGLSGARAGWSEALVDALRKP